LEKVLSHEILKFCCLGSDHRLEATLSCRWYCIGSDALLEVYTIGSNTQLEVTLLEVVLCGKWNCIGSEPFLEVPL